MPLLQAFEPIAVEQPPAPPVEVYRGLGLTWFGWDGSQWRLTDWTRGVFVTNAGVRGLTMPPLDTYTSTSPTVAGSRWRGVRTLDRECFLPIYIFHDAAQQAWIDLDRAFWRTMHPEKVGVLAATQPSGETRRLECRFVDDGDWAFTQDPTTFGWASYGIRLSGAPYWQGEPIVREWRAAEPVPFFGPPGVVNISSGSTLGTATITNPGDVTGHVMWTVFGPSTSAQLGVRGKTIEIPFAVPDGQALRVDTRPDRLLATLHNVTDGIVSDRVVRDLTDSLGDAQWTGIPAGADVPLSLAIAGTGSVCAELIPLFYRMW